MPINALEIIALGAEFARDHPAQVPQGREFVLVGFVVVVVGARVVRAVFAQEVDVAEL